MSDHCQCTLAGWCERHNVKKSSNHVKLCQAHGSYWYAWERGLGPGQVQGKPLTKKQIERKKRIIAKTLRDKRLRGWLTLFRSDADTGLGDTVSRFIPKADGKPLLKAELKELLHQCSCRPENAAAELNRQYPYDCGQVIP